MKTRKKGVKEKETEKRERKRNDVKKKLFIKKDRK